MTTMKNTRKNLFSIVFAMALICLIIATIIPAAAAAEAVDLGTAGDYVILSKT